ncbi:dipeptidase [Sediminitomix flava]|uniref:Acetylornithine deacetylase/succinyl-diaminopimelate desuccinylase-like protein n=1 Tax=Sediminitomix flava TaxID=379075 RepID=A0A315ZFS0_SEDFL|nr:dipeptidase [Sediminitomix flava]PWJ44361.1 acetylornithine deacetylase/succinyl-diaminopimelate desuccinylase-like protein [Sediminitomix flava]
MKAYIDEHKERFTEELFELLRIPSVSTDSSYRKDVEKAAEFLANQLTKAGADNVEICPTPGNPIVYGEKLIDSELPTVLVYGHYDVQPADPIDLWHTPPFEPEIRNGKIFARGASDDKGQMYMHVKAFETMMATDNLTCNVKFMLEGEEEIGSVNLTSFVQANKEKLEADVILVSDTGMIAKDIPSITVGLRGLSYMEVEVTGPNRDLHSGLYGGAVMNPINAITKMISSLTNEKGEITIPGFYDTVEEVSAADREAMAKAPFDLDAYKAALDIKDVFGEEGYSTNERASIRPSLDVNGIWGGYTEEGAKTVIPSKAYAKISMRLVPGQDWEVISELFAKHFESLAPAGTTVKVTAHHGGYPAVIPTDSEAYKAASNAYEESFGTTPIPVRSGGSIPIVPMFKDELGLDSIMMGFGLNEDAIHSPNESFEVELYHKGIETIALFYKYFAKK